jgi:hypothetical protein
MTTQDKTDAIKKIVANHQDNLNAVNAAGVQAGLMPVVTEAMNESFKKDLSPVFAVTTRPAV